MVYYILIKYRIDHHPTEGDMKSYLIYEDHHGYNETLYCLQVADLRNVFDDLYSGFDGLEPSSRELLIKVAREALEDWASNCDWYGAIEDAVIETVDKGWVT
jgi:hypothetical protein